MSILVVEDDAMIRAVLVRVLLQTGHAVLEATNGAEGLLRLRATRPRPVLILLDLMMPVMDGMQFRQAQLADPELACIPVVVLSAVNLTTSEVDDLSAAAVLLKPVDLVYLLDTVARLIGLRVGGEDVRGSAQRP